MDNGLLSGLSKLIEAGNVFEDKEIYSWTALFIVLDWTQCHISDTRVAVHVCSTTGPSFAVLFPVLLQCTRLANILLGENYTLESISSSSNTRQISQQITSGRPLCTGIEGQRPQLTWGMQVL